MKLGIIGTGKIVHEALFAMEEITEIERTAIFARPHSREKGQALASKYGISQVYTDYEELLQKSGVDCVYIGLVNSAHFSYAKQALLAGVHVILEKPFVSLVSEPVLCLTAKDRVRLLPALNIPQELLEKAAAVILAACAV